MAIDEDGWTTVTLQRELLHNGVNDVRIEYLEPMEWAASPFLEMAVSSRYSALSWWKEGEEDKDRPCSWED